MGVMPAAWRSRASAPGALIIDYRSASSLRISSFFVAVARTVRSCLTNCTKTSRTPTFSQLSLLFLAAPISSRSESIPLEDEGGGKCMASAARARSICSAFSNEQSDAAHMPGQSDDLSLPLSGERAWLACAMSNILAQIGLSGVSEKGRQGHSSCPEPYAPSTCQSFSPTPHSLSASRKASARVTCQLSNSDASARVR
jgi:hypothetical protein